jgi:hypothetical protein
VSRDRSKILYIGDLSPKPGGTTVFGDQLVAGLNRRGHTLQAIAGITPDLPADGRFEADHPHIPVVRYAVPHFEENIRNPASPDHRTVQAKNLMAVLAETMCAFEPDTVVVGHPVFAYGLPDFLGAHNTPLVVVAHGAFDTKRPGGYRPDLSAALIEICQRAALLVVVADYLRPRFAEIGLFARSCPE